MRFKLGELFFLSTTEKGRREEPNANPREISSFEGLHEVIAHSLKEPHLIHTQTALGNPLQNPMTLSRPFEDENLLKKLIQYRSQIPVSHRIIRAPRS
jgi:hypothetical protein